MARETSSHPSGWRYLEFCFHFTNSVSRSMDSRYMLGTQRWLCVSWNPAMLSLHTSRPMVFRYKICHGSKCSMVNSTELSEICLQLWVKLCCWSQDFNFAVWQVLTSQQECSTYVIGSKRTQMFIQPWTFFKNPMNLQKSSKIILKLINWSNARGVLSQHRQGLPGAISPIRTFGWLLKAIIFTQLEQPRI